MKLPGGWALGIHIPQSGPLTPEAVDSSLLHARTFFARHFPDKSAPVAVCASWLLDPYLTDHLPQNANIVAFAGRFTPLAPPCDDATAALFFVFRTRDVHLLATLPRRTTLQRLVVDRAQNNELWQIGTGYMML